MAAAAARQRRWQRGGSVGCAVAASAERWRPRSSGAATVGSFSAALAAQGRRRQCSGGVGCGGGSSAVAGSGAAGRRQRRQQSGGGGGSTALALARWQRRRRRQPNHPCHGATDSAINCSHTAWRRSSVPLRNRVSQISAIAICELRICEFSILFFGARSTSSQIAKSDILCPRRATFLLRFCAFVDM